MLDGEVIALQRVILADSDKFPDIAETFYHKAISGPRARWRTGCGRSKSVALIEFDDADAAAGMLLGMLAFQPQRAVMFGHRPRRREKNANFARKTCARLFLRGCRSLR